MLLTHHHFDHVSEVPTLRERWPELKVLIHPLELELLDGIAADTVQAGETLSFGALEVRPLHTPGHTAGMLSFLRSRGERPRPRDLGERRSGGFTGGEAVVFTGDTLFRGSVGGVRAPGHTTYTDLRDSIMGTLMELPGDTVIHPGPRRPDDRRAGVGGERRSSASGAGSTRRARSAARRWASRRRWSCSARTTTAARRPGCAGRMGRTTSSPGPG